MKLDMKLGIGAGLVGILIYGFVFLTQGGVGGTGDSIQNLTSYSSASSTVWSIGPDEVLTVLPAKTNRGYVLFENFSGSEQFICFAATCAEQTGILITASSTYEIDSDNLYTGDVTASAAASTSLVITELRF